MALLSQCASMAGTQVSDIKILKQISSYILKDVDGNNVLCPKEVFYKHGRHLDTLLGEFTI